MSFSSAPSTSSDPNHSDSTKQGEVASSDYYFESYAHFGIHEEMLKDRVRTLSYRDSIMDNPHLFKDKVVLDVGCGTGILSLFAARAGAKHVFALDCSEIIEHAKEIVAENGFQDKITLIRGKVEDITLPVDKVDIIISEWMGYCLLYENMLESVIIARDKWLAEDGLMFPDKANMFILGIEDYEYRTAKIDWWDNVYGFKMSCIKKEALQEPLVDICSSNQVMTNSVLLKSFDLKTVKKEDLSFVSPFTIRATRRDVCHAVVVYFTVEFTHGHVKIILPTGPMNIETHWKQTVFYIPSPISMNARESIEGLFSIHSNARNPRDMDIDIAYAHTAENSEFVYTPASHSAAASAPSSADSPLLAQLHPKNIILSSQEMHYILR